MENQRYAIPNSMTSEDVKYTRSVLGMSQSQLAKFIGVSPKTVAYWESGKNNVTGPVVLLLRMLREDRSLPEYYTMKPMSTPLRLLYMHRNDICTVIDVNDRDQFIEIQNYTRSPLFRAFGSNTEPTYKDYEDFLEERCFPRSRDKMKLQLDHLGLPFYDPLLIIEKTEGRMAEDDFWIKIERS